MEKKSNTKNLPCPSGAIKIESSNGAVFSRCHWHHFVRGHFFVRLPPITLSKPKDRQKIYTHCVFISDTAFNGLVLIVHISEPRAIYHFRLFVLRSLAVYNYDFTIEAARQSENVLNANIYPIRIHSASLLDQLHLFASVF